MPSVVISSKRNLISRMPKHSPLSRGNLFNGRTNSEWEKSQQRSGSEWGKFRQRNVYLGRDAIIRSKNIILFNIGMKYMELEYRKWYG